jgi:hypothetical protein
VTPENDQLLVPRCAQCGEPLPLSREHDCKAPKERRPATEAWHRPLVAGRAEILCRTPGYHLRVSAPEAEVWQFVELFEEVTGLQVESDRRPRRVKNPPPGQIDMLDLLAGDEDPTNQLESERND